MSENAKHSTLSKDGEKQEDVNLRRCYPPAFRSILFFSFPWLLSYLLVIIILLFLASFRAPMEAKITPLQQIFDTVFYAIVVIGFLLCLGKLLYELIYHYLYYYGIEQKHLVISKGIILKERGSFPLSLITEVHLTRGVIEFLFGLYYLRLMTPSSSTTEIATIQGLRKDPATKLQNYLTSLVDKSHTASEER